MSSSSIAELRQQRYNGTVVEIRRIHSDLMVLRVKSDFPRPMHKPGQYCTLGLGYWEPRVDGCQSEALTEEDQTKLVRRSYSISCSIYSEPGKLRDLAADDWLEFYIVLVRENSGGGRVPALTPRLFQLQSGDRLQIGERIVGHFTLDPVKPGDTVIFLGTGTGEAPHNYMLWDLLQRNHSGRIIQACCVRYQRDLGYLETHHQLMKQFANYTYVPLTTRESTDASKKKYIQDLITSGQLAELAGGRLDPATTHVYLCGNPLMIGVAVKDPLTGARTYPASTGVIELLEKQGFAADNAATKLKGNIHFEEYW